MALSQVRRTSASPGTHCFWHSTGLFYISCRLRLFRQSTSFGESPPGKCAIARSAQRETRNRTDAGRRARRERNHSAASKAARGVPFLTRRQREIEKERWNGGAAGWIGNFLPMRGRSKRLTILS